MDFATDLLVLMLATIVATSITTAVFYESHVSAKNQRIAELEEFNSRLVDDLVNADAFGFCQVCIHNPAVSHNRLCRYCEKAANPFAPHEMGMN